MNPHTSAASAKTRTDSFAIGFRRGWSDWQKDLGAVIDFARRERFAFIDVGPEPVEVLGQIQDAGLRIGTVDLPQPWSALASPDAGRQKEAVDRAATYARQAVTLGVKRFFAVMFPEDETRSRRENLELAAEGYGRLCGEIESTGAMVVLEGFPGRAPFYPALACTPESCRAVFEAIPSRALGLNFDPSHLVRMGIDPVRFCQEFVSRIGHVHAKDTAISPDDIYKFGTLQSATLGEIYPYGGHHWRYCIPGHGLTRWQAISAALAAGGYRGGWSIELEDMHFNGSRAGEQRGLMMARDFLTDL